MTNFNPNPTVSLLHGLMDWIINGVDDGPRPTAGLVLEFTWVPNYELTGQSSKIIMVFKQGAAVGRIIPIYKEGTNELIKWVIQRDTMIGTFIDEVDPPCAYAADYAVNAFLVDATVLKNTYEERACNRLKIQTSVDQINGTRNNPYKVKMAEFIEVLIAPMGNDTSELGFHIGFYKITDVESFKETLFECWVAGDETQNWVQCMVLYGSGKFPRLYGIFKINSDGCAVIESRYFKGSVPTGIRNSQLPVVIETYLVKPHANNGTK